MLMLIVVEVVALLSLEILLCKSNVVVLQVVVSNSESFKCARNINFLY